MNNVRTAFHNTVGEAQRRLARTRGNSLSTVPPKETDDDHIPELAACAASILYQNPTPSPEGRPLYVLNAAAFPDADDVDYDSLLSYVLDRLPKEDALLSGTEYEIVFFAGGQPEGATTEKKNGPGIGWYIRAYEVLSRALRKKLQRLYIVHPRTWVRVLLGAFSTIVSPKFRRKLIHANTLTVLAEYIPVEQLLIPPSVYVQDRRVKPEIYVPYATGRRAFGARQPLPKNLDTGEARLPRVLRETSSFILTGENVDTEGLFRIPPNAVLSGVLKEAYDRGQRWIVWKERNATLVEPGLDQRLIDYIRLEDAYPVHLAAALIKVWYRELREPVFAESSYDKLKEQFGAHDADITTDDLVAIFSAEDSPVGATSQAILTRHLIPLLWRIATHADSNKMSGENLAIVFSMCMVCGSNQMEDAKIASTIIKKLLIAAIDGWPQLRKKLGISEDAFWEDLRGPRDPREYEDPFDEPRPPRPSKESEDDAVEGREAYINLRDAEMQQEEASRPPALPPRPQAASSSAVSSTATAMGPPDIPKRKPAPRQEDSAPPRYSTMFDVDGRSLQAESPATYAPAYGFGTATHATSVIDEGIKKGFLPPVEQPAIRVQVPKRKAVSGEHKTPVSAESGSPMEPPLSSQATAKEPARSSSDTRAMAMYAAQKAASTMSGRSAFKASPADIAQSPEAVSASSEPAPDDPVFRKPSWPASARPQTLAKPVLPARPQQPGQTVPIINQPSAPNGPTAAMHKVRAPSPGLLKRMSSMEGAGGGNPPSRASAPGSLAAATGEGEAAASQRGLEPRKLNLKKQSVEDLRRLYEERNSVAASLERAEASRRKSAF